MSREALPSGSRPPRRCRLRWLATTLFDTAIGQTGGTNVRPRGEGDTRFAVFTSAPAAAAASLTIQQSFAAEAWPTPRPIKVRVGIHTAKLRSVITITTGQR